MTMNSRFGVFSVLPLALLTACGAASSSAPDDATTEPLGTPIPNACLGDKLYFNGDCRGSAYFENRATKGSTFVAALGRNTMPTCKVLGSPCGPTELTIVEERDGEVTEYHVTDDVGAGAQISGVYHASGFRILWMAQHQYLPTSHESFQVTRISEPRLASDPVTHLFSYALKQTGYHTDDTDGWCTTSCGTDVAAKNAANGVSGDCITACAEPSSGTSTLLCDIWGQEAYNSVWGSCVSLAGLTAVATDLEATAAILVSKAAAGFAVGTLTACGTMASKVSATVQGDCNLGIDKIKTIADCLANSTPHDVVDASSHQAVFESDGTGHKSCDVTVSHKEECSLDYSSTCSCETISGSCTTTSCDDGYTTTAGDCG